MIGWIALGLFIAGVSILFMSQDSYGDSGETRMSNALVGGFGFLLIGAAIVVVLGAGLWALF
jgi:hypothetical protein